MVKEKQMSHHAIKMEDKLKRFNRIIGQLNGIKQMVEKDRDCAEVLMQIASARAALAKIGLMMAEDHLDHCITTSAKKGESKNTVSSMMSAMKQLLK